MKKAWIVAVLAFAAFTAVAADKATPRTYAAGDAGTFAMSVPAGWTDRVEQPQPGAPATITLGPGKGKPFQVMVTPISPAKAKAPVSTPGDIRTAVQRVADDIKPQAVEKAIPLVELKGAAGSGFYFSVTDKAPKPGEFKYMTQGILKVGELTVSFTILTNDGQAKVRKDALAMLAGATRGK